MTLKRFRVYLDITTGPPIVTISGKNWKLDDNGNLHVYDGLYSADGGFLPIASFAAGLWVWIRDEGQQPPGEATND